MTHRKPNNILQPRPATLRADSLHARRESEDAVILPIVYELTEPNCGVFNPDSVIVPITWPLRRFATSVIPLEIPGKGADRKKKLALLKHKVESARERAAKTNAIHADRHGIQTEDSSAKPDSVAKTESKPAGKAGYLPNAVPLLLLCVIVLVVFAWACFR